MRKEISAKTNIFTFWPSVSAAEFKGSIWLNVKFLNFSEKMSSTPSKTNYQANYFGSKVVHTESNENSEKKAPIWQLFVQSDKEKK